MLYTRRAGAALRRARQPAGARGGARRRARRRRRALAARRRLRAVRRLAGGLRRAAARARPTRCGSAATASAGPPTRTTRPTTRSCRARCRPCREALGDALVERARRPAVRPRATATRYVCHASPVSDVRSFLPEPGDDEAELLAGVTAPAADLRPHPPALPPRARDGIELVNPGSVGMPFDGDTRAAYALVHDDGAIEHRRVDYDHAASAARVRERFGARLGRRRRAPHRAGRDGGLTPDSAAASARLRRRWRPHARAVRPPLRVRRARHGPARRAARRPRDVPDDELHPLRQPGDPLGRGAAVRRRRGGARRSSPRSPRWRWGWRRTYRSRSRPGLGINAVVAFDLVLGRKLPGRSRCR